MPGLAAVRDLDLAGRPEPNERASAVVDEDAMVADVGLVVPTEFVAREPGHIERVLRRRLDLSVRPADPGERVVKDLRTSVHHFAGVIEFEIGTTGRPVFGSVGT